MKGFVLGLLVVAASQGALWGEEGARCQAEAGEVVSLEQRPAVPGTELGVGLQVVTQGEKGEPASPWCNQQACIRAGMDGEEICGTAASWHCFT